MSALNQIRFNLAVIVAQLARGEFSKARFACAGLARGVAQLFA